MKLKQKAKANIRKDTISNAHLRKSKTSKGKLLRVVQRKTIKKIQSHKCEGIVFSISRCV